MNQIKYLFDAKSLLDTSKNEEEVTITLARIEEIDPKPTLTVKLSDRIREKQRSLFDSYNHIIFRGKQNKQELEVKSNKTDYAKALVDLCVIGSTGLFDAHDNSLLKRAFLRQPAFMNYIVSELTKVFEGSVKLAEEEDGEDEKN
jgi:hypothetical protein